MALDSQIRGVEVGVGSGREMGWVGGDTAAETGAPHAAGRGPIFSHLGTRDDGGNNAEMWGL